MNISAYSETSSHVIAGFPGNYAINTASPTRRVNDPATGSSDDGYTDTVTLSKQGKELAETAGSAEAEAVSAVGTSPEEKSLDLSKEELQQLQKLKARDAEVRAHEQAHLSVAGPYAKGSASFTLQKGPDGSSYAVGGEVGIDMGAESTPDATIEKMRTIRRAALAPANPSSTDRRIAAQASAKEAQARQEQMAIDQEELLAAEKSTDQTNKPVSSSEPNSTIRQANGPSLSTLKAGLAAYSMLAEQ